MNWLSCSLILAKSPENSEWAVALALIIFGTCAFWWLWHRLSIPDEPVENDDSGSLANKPLGSVEKWKYQFRPEKRKSVFDRLIEDELNSKSVPNTPNNTPAEISKTTIKINTNTTQQKTTGGLELLEDNFLVEMVNQVTNTDSDDLTMHMLALKEMIRRDKLNLASSKALAFYTLNKTKEYDKKIQCAAMLELAKRTDEENKQKKSTPKKKKAN